MLQVQNVTYILRRMYVFIENLAITGAILPFRNILEE